MMKKILLALFFAALSCVARADFDSALKKYQDKQFEGAGAEFMALAEKGDRDAQFNLGVMYLRGEFYKKDLVEAYAWIALSAEGRNENTKKIKDNIYAKLSAEEKKKADNQFALYTTRYSFRVASTSLEPELTDQFMSSTVLAEKVIVPKYPITSRRLAKESIFQIVFMISNDGRVRHIQPPGLENENIAAAIAALKKWKFPSVDQQDHIVLNPFINQRFSFRMTGQCITRDNILSSECKPPGPLAVNVKESIDKYASSAASGDSLAQTQLAAAYGYGYSVLEDGKANKINIFNMASYLKLENPNKWYAMAANQGMPEAQFMLGMNMMCGNMCVADKGKSLAWVVRAAQAGLTDAQLYLALNLLQHRKSADDVSNAFKWLELAARKNHSAMAIYAWILATSEDKQFLDAKKANELIAKVPEDYIDQLSYFETKAAVAARLGDYEQAKTLQEKALDEAEEYDYPDKFVKARLAGYESGKPWSEAF